MDSPVILSAAQWARVRLLYEQALAQPPAQREAYVRGADESAAVLAEALGLLAQAGGSPPGGRLAPPVRFGVSAGLGSAAPAAAPSTSPAATVTIPLTPPTVPAPSAEAPVAPGPDAMAITVQSDSAAETLASAAQTAPPAVGPLAVPDAPAAPVAADLPAAPLANPPGRRRPGVTALLPIVLVALAVLGLAKSIRPDLF